MLKIPKSTIDRHIQHLRLVKKLGIWIPHQLKEINLTKHINACDLHLTRDTLKLLRYEKAIKDRNSKLHVCSK